MRAAVAVVLEQPGESVIGVIRILDICRRVFRCEEGIVHCKFRIRCIPAADLVIIVVEIERILREHLIEKRRQLLSVVVGVKHEILECLDLENDHVASLGERPECVLRFGGIAVLLLIDRACCGFFVERIGYVVYVVGKQLIDHVPREKSGCDAAGDHTDERE